MNAELYKIHSGHSPARRAAMWLLLLVCFLSCGGRLLAQSGTTNTLTSATAKDLQDALNGGGNVVLNFNGTIATSGNPFYISTDVILDAVSNSIALSGGGSTPVFIVPVGVTLEVRNLTISGGRSTGANGTNGPVGSNGGSNRGGNGGNGSAGTAVNGGAVYNEGTSRFINCVFFTNSVAGGSGGAGGTGQNNSTQAGNGGNGGNGGKALGGAIYNLNTLLLSNCTFTGNSALGGNGGAGGTNGSGNGFTAYSGAGGTGGLAEGAAVYNGPAGTVRVLACMFMDNFSVGGSSQSATGVPNGSGNGQNGPAGATSRGGGLFNAGAFTIINSTFFANLAVGGNGGNGADAPSGSFTAGTGGNGGAAYGGGIYNESTGAIVITNCTFDGGQTFGGTNGLNGSGPFVNGSGAIGGVFGANIANNGGSVFIKNSILANPTNAANTSGTFQDGGFNISSDTTPAFTQSSSHKSTNALLGVPANNGGPTQTISFGGNSPAKDAITDGSAPPLDQRGVDRSATGKFPDIGAFESGTPQYSISGNVGTATAGILVFATGTNGSQHSLVTDSLGNFTFSNFAAGTYTITPPPTNGFSFTPTNRIITVPPTTNGVSFSATPVYTIGGVISSATSAITVNLYTITNGNSTFYTQVNTTVSNGLYTFNNIPLGTYTIIPQGPTYGFIPASISLSVPPSNTNENFNAVPPTYTVSGVVSNVHSSITLVATLGATTNIFSSITSDTSGNYSFASLPAGAYTIIPQQTNGYFYSPASLSVTVPPSTNSQNFNAAQTTSSISGKISNLHQVVNITATSSTSTNSTSTDSSGNYSFASLPSGTYTIVPQSVSGVTYSPSSVNVTLPPTAVSKNFAAITATHSVIAPPHISGNKFIFAITGTPNVVYRIQTATNLISPVWTDIATNTAAADGTISVTNTVANSSALYYRAVTP